jgi:broad specificity phosphatase PhoE
VTGADWTTAGTSDDARTGTRIYLVRHGQTALNESGVLRGHLDPPLDDTGRHQAQKIGLVLGSRHPAVIIASPLRRAIQTAEPVAERTGLVVETDECLMDRDYGEWAGVSRQAVIDRWGSVDAAPGVEPQQAVRARAVDALSGIARRCPSQTAVVVSHDAVTKQVLVALDPGLGDADELPQDNGCYNTLEWRDGKWAVLGVNELPAEA